MINKIIQLNLVEKNHHLTLRVRKIKNCFNCLQRFNVHQMGNSFQKITPHKDKNLQVRYA